MLRSAEHGTFTGLVHTHALTRHVRPARQEFAFPLQKICRLKAEIRITKYKLFLSTSERTFLNFLLLTFSKQAC